VPWLFDEEAVDVLRFFTKFKCRLMPYLYGAAIEARETGVPMLRAMALEFPDDPGCDALDLQYMLGESLLVAPVFSHDGTVDVYVPAGQWTNVLSGERIEGGGWIRQTHDTMSLPLLARPNSVIPFGAVDDQPDYEYSDGVTFHVFELAEGATASTIVPTLDGEVATRLTVRREGEGIAIEVDGASGSWSVLLRGIDAIASIEGGCAETGALGVRLLPEADVRTLRVRL
jgi:alpha-D-xyloside xylohydrolase